MKTIEQLTETDAIYIENQQDYDRLMRLLDGKGYVWEIGSQETHSNLFSQIKGFCLRIMNSGKIRYAEMDYYKSEEYTIHNAKEFLYIEYPSTEKERDAIVKELNKMKFEMSVEEAIEILKKHQLWRTGCINEFQNVKDITNSINTILKDYESRV